VLLTAERVQPLLRGSFGRDVYLHAESCPSTQRLAPPDAPHGMVAVTEHQTEGRGRLGREWVDAPGSSLLFSVVLRPARPVAEWPTLTGVAGEAAAAAVEAVAGVVPTVKPPNDLLLDGGKLAGILAEAQEGRIVLGVGVNVGAAPYPGAALLGASVDRAELLAELLARLERAFEAWEAMRPAADADAELVARIFDRARAAQGLPHPRTAAEHASFTARFDGLETWLCGARAFAALGADTLEYLYVDPDAQGRMIGSTLLALAKQRRPDGFRLWVFQRLARSRRFYELHGCRLLELTDGSANRERLPDALYEWRPTTTAPGSSPAG
jgi:biotin-[acetyl-CoA-carboxylase] ligase BirA-like protein